MSTSEIKRAEHEVREGVRLFEQALDHLAELVEGNRMKLDRVIDRVEAPARAVKHLATESRESAENAKLAAREYFLGVRETVMRYAGVVRDEPRILIPFVGALVGGIAYYFLDRRYRIGEKVVSVGRIRHIPPTERIRADSEQAFIEEDVPVNRAA